MPIFSRSFFVLCGLVLAACDPQSQAPSVVPNTAVDSQDNVKVYRDRHGMPHVFAETNYGVYLGYGYAVAEDRLYQMEMLKRTVEGRVAEVLGEKYLELDSHIRSSYDHRSIAKQLDQLPDSQRELLKAYAAGFNRKIAEVLENPSELMPKEFIDNGFEPQVWRDYDVAMLFAGAIAHRYSDFNSERDNLALVQSFAEKGTLDNAWNMFDASKWLLDNNSPTTVPRQGEQVKAGSAKPAYLSSLPELGKTQRVAIDAEGSFQGISSDPVVDAQFSALLAKHGFSISPEFSPASNFWAVNNQRAKGAKGILVNGPQFGWGLPSYVYGISLHGGDFNVVGNTLLGLPSLLFAHNNEISWGSTAGLSDQVDEFILTLNPENPEQYWHNDSYKEFDSWSETIAVKDAAPVTITARKAAQGMVLQHDGKAGLAVSRARAWDGQELASLMAWIELSKQKTIAEAKAAVAKVTTNINFYYMDKQGNIAYTHGGKYPQRAPGHDSRIPAPGDGSMDWLGLRPYSESPTVENPEQGFIANWNNRPSADWLASDLWFLTWSRADRNQLIIDRLLAAGEGIDEGLDQNQVWSVNRDISFHDINFPFLLPYLQQAMKSAKLNDIERAAFAELNSWDQQWIADEAGKFSAAATIADSWLKQLLLDVFQDDVANEFLYLYSATGNPNHSLGASMGPAPGTKAMIRNLDALAAGDAPVYDFFNGNDWQQQLSKSFSKTIKNLMNEQGAVPSAWRVDAVPMVWQPVNFRGVPQADPNQGVEVREYMNRGSENNLFVATGDGFTAYDSVPPGQSAFISPAGVNSPHYRDQMDMFSKFEYKLLPFEQHQIKELAESVKVIKVTR